MVFSSGLQLLQGAGAELRAPRARQPYPEPAQNSRDSSFFTPSDLPYPLYIYGTLMSAPYASSTVRDGIARHATIATAPRVHMVKFTA